MGLESGCLFACPTITLVVQEVLPRTPPDTRNSCQQDPDNNHRTGIGAWIHVPGPLLNRPYDILKDWVHTAPPEQKRGGPGDIRIELVVQGPCKEHTNCISCKNRRQDIVWRDSN